MTMHISYDSDADVMYVHLSDADAPTVSESIGIGIESEGLTADMDRTGHVVGLEIQFASRRFGTAGVQNAVLELLGEGRPAA